MIERSLELLIGYDDVGFPGSYEEPARAVWLIGESEATAWRSPILVEEKDVKTNSKERILIADDDRDFRQILVRRAERMGLLVVEVEDGQQAIDALRQNPFDVVLADLYMPKHNGLEVAQIAHEVDPHNGTILYWDYQYWWKVMTWDLVDSSGSYSQVATFTMADIDPTFQVIEPNGGEVWIIGNQSNIYWSKGHTQVDSVCIELSTSSSSNWMVLISSTITNQK